MTKATEIHEETNLLSAVYQWLKCDKYHIITHADSDWTQPLARQRGQVKKCVKTGIQLGAQENISLEHCVQELSLSPSAGLQTFTGNDELWIKYCPQNLYQAFDFVGRAAKGKSEQGMFNEDFCAASSW